MPGTLPYNDFTNVTIRSVAPTVTTLAVSGIRQSKQIAGQYWELDAEFASLGRGEFNEIMGFVSRQRNSLFTFDVVVPVISDSAGDIMKLRSSSQLSDAMVVTSNVARGQTQVAFDTAYDAAFFTAAGLNPARGMLAGDFIRFGNHNKVYQLTENVTFNATGGGFLNFFPNLIDPVPVNTTITYNAVPFTVFSRNDIQEYQFGIGNENIINLQLLEAV
jgi:hypothetical protein